MAKQEDAGVKIVIKKQMKDRNIKRDVDVQELYLSDNGITHVDCLSRYRNLRYLWLNGNKLRRLLCLSESFRLSELYLQNNELVNVTGALAHLTSLQVLMLQNNQLTNLQNVIQEFTKMSDLRTLNLFDNPVAQEPDYRIFVIKNVPSVELLDREEVMYHEKKQAKVIYSEKAEAVSRTIAFGRRAPQVEHDNKSKQILFMDATYLGNSYFRDNPPFDTNEEAMQYRRNRNMVSLFTHFDWSKVPRIEERRMSDKPFDSPQLLTHAYR